jgi:radical SAM protein with 4Fe4S-binding SPASM domain
LPGGGYLRPFGLAASSLRVLSDGTIVPYCMLADMVLGHINQDPLEHIWRKSPVLNRLRRRQTIPLGSFDFCTGCDYIPYCTGGDPVSAHVLTGEVNHPDPAACLHRFLMQGGRMNTGKA